MKRVCWILPILLILSCRSANSAKRLAPPADRNMIALNEQLYQQQKQIEQLGERIILLEKKLKEDKERKPVESEPAEKIFRQGYELFLKKSYQEAISMLELLLPALQSPQITEAALFYRAKALEAIQEIDQAIKNYELLIVLFPQNQNREEILLKLINHYEGKAKLEQALFWSNYFSLLQPESVLAKSINNRIKQIKKKQRR